MTNQVSDPAEAQAKKIATFYVVPIKSGPTTTEDVFYYREGKSSDQQWIKLDARDLDAGKQGHNIKQAALHQPLDVAFISQHTGLDASMLATDVRLYAAVAKTLQGTDKLKELYSLDSEHCIKIDVNHNTTRGVILVFTQNGLGDSSSVIRLIASTDPEIKNSTGGTTDCP